METVQKLHADNLQYIDEENVRIAYRYLVEVAPRLPNHACYPEKLGTKRLFRYTLDNEPDRFVFDFIVAKKWLLFYLRRPFRNRHAWSVEKLKESGFSDVKENEGSELTIRIHDKHDAERLMHLLFPRLEPSCLVK